MSIAGHVSRDMLSRYSHARMEAKRCAPDEIAAPQRAADENRKENAKLPDHAEAVLKASVIQSRKQCPCLALPISLPCAAILF